MIEVQLPDGRIVEFPDGTSRDVMKGALNKFTMRERIAAAKDGTLEMRPGSEARAAAANEIAMGQMAPPVGAVEDVAKSFGSGLERGSAGLLSAPSDLMNAYSGLVTGALEGAGIVSPETAQVMGGAMRGSVPGGGSIREVAGALGADYKPQTTAGEYAGTVGEFIPGAAIGGGAKSILQYGVLPGLASEAAGQSTDGTSLEPYARFAAGLLAPLAVSGAAALGRKVISPYGGVDPERLKLAKVLDDFGVPITAGQRTGAEGLRKAEAATSRGQVVMDDQADAFTEAALKAIGTNANRATPEVMEETAKRIGGVFDDIYRGVDVTPDAKSLTEFSQAMATYRQLAPKATEVPLLGNINREMVKAFRTQRPIEASVMANWRSGLSKLTTSPDAATREAAISALEAVDGALAGSLSAIGRVDDVARLATARGQWRDFLAIQKAAARAGSERALGVISPSALRNELAAQGSTAMARGKRGDIGALARAGEAVMKPLPAVTAGGVREIANLPSIAGAGLGAQFGGPIGAMAGLLAPSAMRAAMMTGAGQRYLANQAIGPGGPILSPDNIRVIPGLLAQ